jgi:hypothetical protein
MKWAMVSEAEGYVSEASEAPAGEEGVGGWPVDAGGGWQGPSAEEWQATQQQIAAVGEFLQLLASEEEQPTFDPFAEDGGRAQIDAMIAEHVAPIKEAYEQLTQQAALEQGAEEASRIVAETASQLGATVDEGAVRQTAESDVAGLAEQLLARAGWTPPQIQAELAARPLRAFEIVGGVFGASVADVARTALEQAVARSHGEATRVKGPDGVLQKYTRQPPPVRSLPRGGPSGVLAAHRRANEGRR